MVATLVLPGQVAAQDATSPLAAQTSPLPTAKIVRPPNDNAEGNRLPVATDDAVGTGAIETQPLNDLTVTTDALQQDGDVAAQRDGLDAPSDGTTGRTSPSGTGTGGTSAATALTDQDTTNRNNDVAVLRPSGTGSDTDSSGDDTAGERQSGQTRWQRARARRFKLAPKSPGRLTVDSPAPIVPIALVSTELKTGARLRQLDKMTGQTVTFDIGIGEERQIARLLVRLDACRAPGDNGQSGTMAFVKVWDQKADDDLAAEFSGWMFADSPALSALDHPRYDLWVINCTTSSAGASAGSE